MSKEQQAQAQPQVAIPLPKAKKNFGSDRMYLHDAFCSNVWTGICNVNSTYPEKVGCDGICRTPSLS